MKKLIVLMLVVTFGLVACSNEENPLDDGVLTIGLEADYAPYNWTTTKELASEQGMQISGSNSYVDGYDVRVAKAVADELNVELEIQKISWDGLIPALQSGKIDAIIAGMSPTDERKQQINFSEAYFKSEPKQVIIVREDSKYKEAKVFADISGANITAQQGTFQVQLLNQLQLSENSTSPLPDYASLIQATSSGTIDGYIAEEAVATSQLKEVDNLIELPLEQEFVLDEGYTTSAIGIAKKNQELVDKINQALQTIDEDTRQEWMNEMIKTSKEVL